jgi:hypothetical protein
LMSVPAILPIVYDHLMRYLPLGLV